METSRGGDQRFAPTGSRSSGASMAPLLAGLLAVAFAAGCAAPSEPIARHPPIANTVTDLTAQQIGTRAFVSFTLPTKTTDRKSITATPSLEIHWAFFPANAPAPNAAAIEKQNAVVRVPSAVAGQYITDGRVRLPVEMKPEDIASHFGGQAAFIVRTLIAEKKSSDASNVAVIRIFPPATPISDLAAKVTQEAVELSWSPVAPPTQIPPGAHASVSYRVYRNEKHEGNEKHAANGTKTAQGASPTSAGKKAKPSRGSSDLPSEPSGESQAEPPPESAAELLGESESPSYRDTSFQFDHTYIYSVRSVVHYGATPAEIAESDDSNLLTLTPKDTFPPAAPTGLIAVIVPTTADVPTHIELSWAISPENDLGGYNIYRIEQGVTPVQKLNASTLLVPSYRDMTVVPGHPYTYTVTAVDRAGNESPASEPVNTGINLNEKESSP